ncbi:trans-sulfuration enzyme family protein [Radicibacter daui]|uniref:trans-sulfuration enzyme family protein n=1 Tax=Radicibacter daui TaxID=3064829 RepID=UPI004046A6C9
MADSLYSKAETLLAQALGAAGPDGAIVPGIEPASTFVRGEDGRTRYGRDDDPTLVPAESVIAALEGGAGCLLFSSGMAACTAPFLALKAGARVVLPKAMYWSLRAWVQNYAADWGLTVDFYDNADTASLAAACARPADLVWVESPANPTWEITDLAVAADLAHKAGALLVVDNTVPTPLLTRPLEFGADLVVHSATKGLNGHSDILAGALVTGRDDAHWQRLKTVRKGNGSRLGAFEAWLLLRGLRTLHLRLERQCASAMKFAEHFAGHAGVREVIYPGLASHPQHALAARQMTGGFGGMLSVRVAGGFKAAASVAKTTRLFRDATSLMGVESLIEHRQPVEGPTSPTPDDLLRISIGVEHVDDLIADFAAALAAS